MSASEPVNETDVETTQKKLWEKQRLLNHRKGSLSSTFVKNAEARTKAYDLNQKTMQTLDTLAEDYEMLAETCGRQNVFRVESKVILTREFMWQFTNS